MILHRAPRHYYGDIEERGLVMAWNPTAVHVTQDVPVPLYYSGLSAARGVASAHVSQEGGPASAIGIGANDTVALRVDLAPRALTWFVITD